MAFWPDSAISDVRFAFRQLRRSPGFAVTAVLTLALGIGATTAIFSLTYQVLLRSLPVRQSGQLYKLGKGADCCVTGGLQDDWTLFSYDLYRYLRDHTQNTGGMTAVDSAAVTVSAHSEGETNVQPLAVRFVEGNYFNFLGVNVFAGRLLTPEDDRPGAAPVAVISHTLWTSKFNSNPHLVGSTLLLTGRPVTIVGITAIGFLGERNTGDPAGLWLPLSQEPVLQPDRNLLNFPAAHWLDVLVRLPSPQAVSSVQASLKVELLQWLRDNRSPDDNATEAELHRQVIELAPANAGINDLQSQYEKSLKLLMSIAAAVLLICCANLANLLLVRAVARRQEISVRTALGAPRWQLIRQMLVEAIAIALLGGVAALGVAFAGVRAMLALAMKGVEVDPLSATPSLPVLLFALCVSLVTGVVFGTAPAWIASRANPAEALRGANRSTGDASGLPQRILVILQAGLSVVLLSMAGLLIQSLRHLQQQDLHFEAKGRLIAFLDLQAAGYRFDQLPGLYRRFDQDFAGLPGIPAIAYSTYGPMANNNWGTGVSFPGGDPMARQSAGYLAVSPRFFQTVGTRILLGRSIVTEDTATSTHVAVVNKSFVDMYLKAKPPLGEHFGPDRAMTGEFQIVGVVDDSKYGNPKDVQRPMFFTPLTQFTTYEHLNAPESQKQQSTKNEQYEHFAANLIVQYQGDPTVAANTVRSTLHSIDPNIVVSRLTTYDEQVSRYFTQDKLVVRLTAIFGVLALVLASIGLYGVTAYNVARRVPEIGLRMALGSDRGGILRLVLRGAMAQTLIGLSLGVPLALLAGHLLRSQLYGIRGFDGTTMVVACGLLALSALVASLVPARRAAGIEPMRALRSE